MIPKRNGNGITKTEQMLNMEEGREPDGQGGGHIHAGYDKGDGHMHVFGIME